MMWMNFFDTLYDDAGTSGTQAGNVAIVDAGLKSSYQRKWNFCGFREADARK